MRLRKVIVPKETSKGGWRNGREEKEKEDKEQKKRKKTKKKKKKKKNKADRHKSRAQVSISHYAEKVKRDGPTDRPTDRPT